MKTSVCLFLAEPSVGGYLKQGEGGGGSLRREPSAQLTFMGRRPCKYGVCQKLDEEKAVEF